MCHLPLKAAFMASPAQPERTPASRTWRRGLCRIDRPSFPEGRQHRGDQARSGRARKAQSPARETFRKAEKAANAAAVPQNIGYKVELADMAKWEQVRD